MKIYLESYGCTLNHGEARYVKQLLTNAGHLFIKQPTQAELIMLFTCCVIGTTELKMIRRAKYFNSLGKPLLVSGCMAVVQREELLKVHDRLRFISPNEISKINDKIQDLTGQIVPQTDHTSKTSTQSTGRLTSSDGEEGGAGEFEESPGASIDAIIPIATGCRGRCTYCITRLARGVLQSKPVDQIVQEITQAVSTGHYELRLTAQDTACYGYDLDTNLAKLSEKITTINSSHDFRVRVGMMNPNSVKPILHELIKAYEHPRIFKFLHLPVQSGDDELLSAMGRGYCVKEFIEILDIFRSAMPELTLSTDFIIGYPNETTEQFEHSLALLEQIRPNIVNITRFSARPGTSAAKLKNRLSGSKIKSRSREMTARRFAISNELNESQIGQRYRVLITERVKAGSVLARNDSYLPVVIKHNLPLGSWVNVEIKDATDSYLVGESNII